MVGKATVFIGIGKLRVLMVYGVVRGIANFSYADADLRFGGELAMKEVYCSLLLVPFTVSGPSEGRTFSCYFNGGVVVKEWKT